MEDLGSPGTEPEIYYPGSRSRVLRTLGHHHSYLQTSGPEIHPSPEGLRSCGKFSVLDNMSALILLRFSTVTKKG